MVIIFKPGSVLLISVFHSWGLGDLGTALLGVTPGSATTGAAMAASALSVVWRWFVEVDAAFRISTCGLGTIPHII